MQCNQFERILEQQDAEPLPEPALAHIAVCEGCRALTADLDAIREMAIGLDAEGIAPPEHIWISLRNQLEAEGIIHEPKFGGPKHQNRLVERLATSRVGGRFSGV